MVKAFIFGKFYPFHMGHQEMIEYAMSKYDHVTVLVCKSDKENNSLDRRRWIHEAFNRELDVRKFYYRESDFTNQSEFDPKVADAWIPVFETMFPDYEVVITSEPYGDYIAEKMGITHDNYQRNHFSFLSGTHIREKCLLNSASLPSAVKKDLCFKVAILGTESTGKTTLATKLVSGEVEIVPEIGRQIVGKSKDCTYKNLVNIVRKTTEYLHTSVNKQILLFDTDVHITESYCSHLFNGTLQHLPEFRDPIHKCDLYLYMNKDCPFVQDGTRLNKKERDALDLSHKSILQYNRIKFHEIRGTWEERFSKAKELIETAVKEKQDKFFNC